MASKGVESPATKATKPKEVTWDDVLKTAKDMADAYAQDADNDVASLKKKMTTDREWRLGAAVEEAEMLAKQGLLPSKQASDLIQMGASSKVKSLWIKIGRGNDDISRVAKLRYAYRVKKLGHNDLKSEAAEVVEFWKACGSVEAGFISYLLPPLTSYYVNGLKPESLSTAVERVYADIVSNDP